AARPHQRHEGSLLDVQREAVHRGERTVFLGNVGETYQRPVTVGRGGRIHQPCSLPVLRPEPLRSSRNWATTTSTIDMVNVKLPMALMRGLACPCTKFNTRTGSVS